jgi:hypothetical protein
MFLAPFGLPVDARADTLSDAHDAMRPRDGSAPRDARPSRSRAPSSAGSVPQSQSEDSESAFRNPVVFVLLLPWTFPWWLCEGGGMRGDTVREFAYERYPYAGDASGALRLGPYVNSQFDKPWIDGTESPPDDTRQVALQVGADQGYVIGGLWRSSVAARLQTPLRLEVDTAWSMYIEPAAQQLDSAWLGSAHVSYRFAQTEHVQFRTGAGYRQWSDSHGTELGVDLFYGIDVFWGRPLTTSMDVHVGNLSDAAVVQFRGTMGILIGRAEILAGYDHLAVQGRTADAALGGPLLGLRLWL